MKIWHFFAHFCNLKNHLIGEWVDPGPDIYRRAIEKRNLQMPIEFVFLFFFSFFLSVLFFFLFTYDITHILSGCTETSCGLQPVQKKGWTLEILHVAAVLLSDWGCIQFIIIKLGFNAKKKNIWHFHLFIHKWVSLSCLPLEFGSVESTVDLHFQTFRLAPQINSHVLFSRFPLKYFTVKFGGAEY